MTKYGRITRHMNQDRFLFYILNICDLKNKKIAHVACLGFSPQQNVTVTISSKDGKFSLKKQPNNCDSRLVIALSQQKFSVLQYANNGSDCICDNVIFIFWVFCSFKSPQRIFLKPETHQRLQVRQSCYDILYLNGLSLLVSFLGGFV